MPENCWHAIKPSVMKRVRRRNALVKRSLTLTVGSFLINAYSLLIICISFSAFAWPASFSTASEKKSKNHWTHTESIFLLDFLHCRHFMCFSCVFQSFITWFIQDAFLKVFNLLISAWWWFDCLIVTKCALLNTFFGALLVLLLEKEEFRAVRAERQGHQLVSREHNGKSHEVRPVVAVSQDEWEAKNLRHKNAGRDGQLVDTADGAA